MTTSLVIVESPAKAKTINKYLGTGLSGSGLLRPCPRPAVEGRLGRLPDEDFAMHWEVDAKSQKRLSDIATAVKDADRLILATDPDREGEAISWHVLRGAERQEGAEGQAGRARRLQRHHQAGRARRDGATRARSTCRWSTPISPAARSTISSASRCRRCCGASCPARARPAACSRWRCASSATARREIEIFTPQEYWSIVATLTTPTGDALRRPRRRLRRAASSAGSTSPTRRRRRRIEAALAGAAFTRRLGRGEAGQAQSAAALHHLDAAAGGLAQARLLRHAHHAGRPAPLRGHRHRRRDRRPHHLHADRRRADRAGGGQRRSARSHRQRTSATATCPRSRATTRPRPRTRRRRTRRSARPTSPARPSRRAPAPRRRPGAALRADLEAHHRQPDGSRPSSSAPPSTSTRRAATQRAGLRATGQVVRFDGFLAALPGGPRRRARTRTAAACRAMARRATGCRSAAIAADAALHRAAAALHRGDADQEDGGARHRPALDLCRDAVGAARPRLCRSSRRSSSSPRTRAGWSPPSSRASSALRRVRLHRRPRGEARPDLGRRALLEGRAARFLAAVLRRRRRDQGPARLRGARRAQRAARPAHLPAAREDGSDPRACPSCGNGPAVAEARQVRRLRRLLELSRVPLHPPARRAAGDERQWRRAATAPGCSAPIPRPAST